MSLIVTGSIGIDSVEAPTGTVQDVLGGSAVYFAAAASFFGPVRLVAAVGDDFPEHHLATFAHFTIDTAGLEHRAGSQTFRWRGRYEQDMNVRETVEIQLNVLGEALPPIPNPYRSSRYVFLANTHPAGQLKLAGQFPRADLVVADTMDLWINTEKTALLDLLRGIDGLVLNDSEARMLTGHSNNVKAAHRITELGPKLVVIKKGEHGALLLTEDGRVMNVPAFPTAKVVDPTGAGDSFAGAMMGCIAATGDTSGQGLRRAVAYGTIVASFNIEAFSLERMKQLSRADIDARFDEFRAMLDVG